jgi:Ca2+-binding RTX toxin-like protein
MRRGLITGLVGLFALGVAPQALASTVTIAGNGGTTVRVLESGDEVNRIAVSFDAGASLYTVSDAAAALTPSGACTAVDAHTATCPGAAIKTISVDTDARDDSIVLDPATIPDTVTENLTGGGGNDQVSGGRGPGTLLGGLGNDAVTGHGSVQGGPGDDVVTGTPLGEDLRGGAGRDLLDGGDGPDDIRGGSSIDTLVYPPERRTPIAVTVGSGNFSGGIEDQGPIGRDTVYGDIEVVVGTAQDDTLVGDGRSETLDGAAGNDTLIGNSGNDTLLGLEGDDVVAGGFGRDLLVGWLGADRLFGGPGNDRLGGGPDDDFLVGNPGHDVMKGKSGIDAIRAKDGMRDLKINCGRGPRRLESAKRDKRLDPKAKSC